MPDPEFIDYLTKLDPKSHDAAKLVRFGIIGDGLTEQRRVEAAPRRQTKCVRRLRECFA
jgi:hypothetical protein